MEDSGGGYVTLARLASPADGSGEAWRAGSGERAQESAFWWLS
jgi:hypothetical protein